MHRGGPPQPAATGEATPTCLDHPRVRVRPHARSAHTQRCCPPVEHAQVPPPRQDAVQARANVVLYHGAVDHHLKVLAPDLQPGSVVGGCVVLHLAAEAQQGAACTGLRRPAQAHQGVHEGLDALARVVVPERGGTVAHGDVRRKACTSCTCTRSSARAQSPPAHMQRTSSLAAHVLTCGARTDPP